MSNWADETRIALDNLVDNVQNIFTPNLRLGVTGLSRSGKTVFITSLIQQLIEGNNLPLFKPLAQGRIIGAKLAPLPNPTMPRFAFEDHLSALTGKDRHWPTSTRQISELRLTIKYQSASWVGSITGPQELNIDIVDYPGEWLLDLPLLDKSFEQWSTDAFERASEPARRDMAKTWKQLSNAIKPVAEFDEAEAQKLSTAFKAYLTECREDAHALSALPPGRFLMPGDLEGSPALSFAPLPPQSGTKPNNSFYATMEKRYEAYKDLVVRPFFRDHFARLDRQIVLVDTLSALNAGPAAVKDLQSAISEILSCFRTGQNNILSSLFFSNIDKILFASTKADHLHHTSHNQLELILNHLVANAARDAQYKGAATSSIALSSVRATREGEVEHEGENLQTIIGTPQKGEVLGDKTYNGKTEIALFPGELPQKPESVFDPNAEHIGQLKFLRFLPPAPQTTETGHFKLPHIRMDRAIEFLIGDKLQ
ncbi:YcjX family protein [Maritalea porphyrae]|uniref:YcjX family protein n=1 Tax=Maritalea porphyrae TaxID=880732 RepID=UPI0022AF172B|nr:YcjX family protein [Maritalea porphyrae]MCZ4272673.1 YcjX family protein [Maritalea porphyrae]